MATRFYLRDLTAEFAPSDGEKSTVLPVGTFSGNSGDGFEDLSLNLEKGSSQISKSINSIAQTAHQDNYMCRFTSLPLGEMSVLAVAGVIAVAVSEGNAAANSRFAESIYIWRPNTSSIVAYLFDTDFPLGLEWATTEDGQILTTLPPTPFDILRNDVLVYEFWRHTAGQGMAASYTQTVYFNGATDVTELTTTDAASYLETAQDVLFTTPAGSLAMMGMGC